MRFLLPLAVLLLLLVPACRMSPSETPEGRPSWVRNPNMNHPEFYYVVGRCPGKRSQDEARRCAVHDAREQLSTTFGVRGGIIRDEYYEDGWGSFSQGNRTILGMSHSAWVLMAFPKKRVRAVR